MGYLIIIAGENDFFKESHPVLLLLHRNEARDKDKLNTSWWLITGGPSLVSDTFSLENRIFKRQLL